MSKVDINIIFNPCYPLPPICNFSSVCIPLHRLFFLPPLLVVCGQALLSSCENPCPPPCTRRKKRELCPIFFFYSFSSSDQTGSYPYSLLRSLVALAMTHWPFCYCYCFFFDPATSRFPFPQSPTSLATFFLFLYFFSLSSSEVKLE